jgi:hypothetical protein
MKKKRYKVGTISDRKLKAEIRKAMPPVGSAHRSIKDYSRKKKHRKNPDDFA